MKLNHFTGEYSGGQTRNVKKIILHEKYFNKNDIALTITDRAFMTSPTFSPVGITEVRPIDNELCSIGKD